MKLSLFTVEAALAVRHRLCDSWHMPRAIALFTTFQ